MSHPDSSHLRDEYPKLPKNPFPGIRPYTAAEDSVFFGRENQVQPILELLSCNHLVTVTGASACGKSSLLNAGIVPLLRDGLYGDHSLIVSLTPGKDPFRAFAEAFTEVAGAWVDEKTLEFKSLESLMEASGLAPERPVIVIVDQFEEVFRLIEDLDTDESPGGPDSPIQGPFRTSAFSEVQNFTQFLSGIPEMEQGYLVIGIRADFLKDCSRFKCMAEIIGKSIYITSLLSRHDLEFAIRSPLQHSEYRCTISQATISAILNDLTNDSDQLPLLQVFLHEAYKSGRASLSDRGADRFDLQYKSVNPGSQRAGQDSKSKSSFEVFLNSLGDQLLSETGVDRERILLFFSCLFHLDPHLRAVREMASLDDIDRASVLDADEVHRIAAPFLSSGWIVEKTGRESGPAFDITHEALLRKWGYFEVLVKRATRLHRIVHQEGAPHFLSPDNETCARRAAGPYGEDARHPESIWAYQRGYQEHVKEILHQHILARSWNQLKNLILFALLAAACASAFVFRNNQKQRASELAAGTRETNARIAEADAKAREADAKTREAEANLAKATAEAALAAAHRIDAENQSAKAKLKAEEVIALAKQAAAEVKLDSAKWREAQAARMIGFQDSLKIQKNSVKSSPGIAIKTYSSTVSDEMSSRAIFDRIHVLDAPLRHGLDFVGGSSLDHWLRNSSEHPVAVTGNSFVANSATGESWQAKQFPGYFIGVYRFPNAILLGGIDSSRTKLMVWWSSKIGLREFNFGPLNEGERIADASISQVRVGGYRVVAVTDGGRIGESHITDLNDLNSISKTDFHPISESVSGVLDVIEMPSATLFLCKQGSEWTLHENPRHPEVVEEIGRFRGDDVRLVPCKDLIKTALFAVLHNGGVTCYIESENDNRRFFPVHLSWDQYERSNTSDANRPTKAAFTQDGDVLAIGTKSGEVLLWEVNREAGRDQRIVLSSEPNYRFELDPTETSPVTAFAWSTSSEGSDDLAAANEAGTIVLLSEAERAAKDGLDTAPIRHLVQPSIQLRPPSDSDPTPFTALSFSGSDVLGAISRAGSIKAFPVKPRQVGKFQVFKNLASNKELAFYSKFSAEKLASKRLLKSTYKKGDPPGPSLDESKYFIAARWDYNLLRKDLLRERPIRVFAVGTNGQPIGTSIEPVWAVDWGPGIDKPYDFQVSNGLVEALKAEALRNGVALGELIQVEFDVFIDTPEVDTP